MAVKTNNLPQILPQKASSSIPSSEFPVKKALILREENEETSPFRRLILRWLHYCQNDGLSDRTILDYQDKVFKFYWWWSDYTRYSEKLGAHPSFVTVEKAREYATYLKTPLAHRWNQPVPQNKRQLSSASIDTYGRAVKVFFNWLEREGHISRTPFNRSVRFSNRNKQDQTIKRVEQDELEKLFAMLTSPAKLSTFLGYRNLAFTAFLFDTGARLGEALSIRLCDIDFELNRCIVTGKTGKREIIFSEVCRTSLLNYLTHEKYPLPLDQKQLKQNTNPLWLTSDGFPLTFFGAESLFRRIRKESGLDKLHPHMARHTLASVLAEKGVNIYDLSRLLGHQSVQTTERYLHTNSKHLSEVHQPNSPLNTLPLAQQEKLKLRRGRPRKV